jgi:tripartite-type tricarboxylate transporter receptor subunit TctC
MLLGGLGAMANAAWPERPVHLLVPYSAGGPNDILARLLAERLGPAIGQPVIVENRPGAGGNIAMEQAAHARPDGQVLVLPAMAWVVNPALMTRMPYRFEDFATVGLVARGPLVLVAPAAGAAVDLATLLARARTQAGGLRYGSGGLGSSPHLAAELFRHESRIELVHVPYKGTNDVLPDLMNGTLDLAFLSPLVVESPVKAGRLRALGVSGAARLPALPAVPAIGEAVPGYSMAGWYALLAPAATPPAVLDRLARELTLILRSGEVAQRLESQGMQPATESRAAASAFMQSEAERWGRVLRAAGVEPQ